MGRRVTDGLAIDVDAPDATAITKGELYRVDNFTGWAAVDIDAADTERAFALNMDLGVWSSFVPAGTCGTKGNYVKWSAGAGFKTSLIDLADDGATRTLNSVAKVVAPRNSGGFARLKLLVL